MKRPALVEDQIYHVFNRGVEKRQIFLEDKDYLRFIHDLFEFNDDSPVSTTHYRKLYEVGPHKRRKERNLLVDILAFCLMPNHFHLLLRQRIPEGISKFMQKLGTGYSMYFNQKYERVGSLYQGKFKAVLINEDHHFIHLPFYIHLNPLDLIAPEWRIRQIKDYEKTLGFLNSYRWSSYLDYIGIKNFPSVTQRNFISQFFNGQEEYRKMTEDWLKTLNLSSVEELLLE